MSRTHALGALARAIAAAPGADVCAARSRPTPAFPPFIRKPTAPRMGERCAECEGQHVGAAELFHITRMGNPFGELVNIASAYPLCPACATAAQRHGWPALARTWRKLCAAPFEQAALHAAQARGGVQ